MSHKLFGIDIAEIVNREISPGLLPCTLIKITKAARDPSQPSANRVTTETSHSGKGFIEGYSQKRQKNSNVKLFDKKITLIANSFAQKPVPSTSDKIVIEGQTYIISGPIDRDPAAATYTCPVKL